MRFAIANYLAVAGLALAHAQDQNHGHDHQTMEASAPGEAPIKITINPEARVSVSRAGELPPVVTCGHIMELQIQVVNQGFVTAPLEAHLVDSALKDVDLEFPAERLKGIREEHRVLRLRLKKPGPLDVTVAFRVKNDIPDLGGRDRVHFLISCQELR
jgi:hypothetical protein